MKKPKNKPGTDRPDQYVTDLRVNGSPKRVAKALMKGGAAPRPETRKPKKEGYNLAKV